MNSPVSRLCKCGCGSTFRPHRMRPGQEYTYGHKPKEARPSEMKARALATARNEEERKKLDYRLALSTARIELAELERKIDAVDEEIDQIRKELHGREAQKEIFTERHLTVDASVMALDALVSGKSLVRELMTETAAK